MCIVGSVARLASNGPSPAGADPQLVAIGVSLSLLPWAPVVLAPLCLLACRNRHQPAVKVVFSHQFAPLAAFVNRPPDACIPPQ